MPSLFIHFALFLPSLGSFQSFCFDEFSLFFCSCLPSLLIVCIARRFFSIASSSILSVSICILLCLHHYRLIPFYGILTYFVFFCFRFSCVFFLSRCAPKLQSPIKWSTRSSNVTNVQNVFFSLFFFHSFSVVFSFHFRLDPPLMHCIFMV